MEPQYGFNLAKKPRVYVRSGQQPHQDQEGQVFARIWNRTEPFSQSKPGLPAGYPDLLVILAVGTSIIHSAHQTLPVHSLVLFECDACSYIPIGVPIVHTWLHTLTPTTFEHTLIRLDTPLIPSALLNCIPHRIYFSPTFWWSCTGMSPPQFPWALF